MRDILRELYDIHGKQTKVAEVLGVGSSTVSQWLKFLGLREKTIVVEINPSKSAENHSEAMGGTA